MGKREQLILEYCHTARRRSEIQVLLGLKDPKDVRKRFLTPLIERGYLTMTNPQQPNSVLQSYLTTNQGWETLRQMIERKKERAS